MKKAKEYADELLAYYEYNKDKDDLKKLVMDYVVKNIFAKLVDEMQDIANSRNCNNDICIEAIMLEQINKWKSIVRKVNKVAPLLNENGFLNVMQSEGLYEHTEKVKKQAFIENKLAEDGGK